MLEVLHFRTARGMERGLLGEGRQPRPGYRPSFHARGFHPVYNARVS